MQPDRTELLRRAREAYREDGRGVLLLIGGREEPHYALREELEERLGDEPNARSLLDWVFVDLNMFGPPEEAVVVDDRPDGIYVLVIREAGACLVGSFPHSNEYERRQTKYARSF